VVAVGESFGSNFFFHSLYFDGCAMSV
jgi:hypothetical protein